MQNEITKLEACQIGMNTSDLAGSLRLFAELGMQNAGGHMIWGHAMAIQGLPPSARGQMYWLLARQERAQLELFHLTSPVQRPQPEDWRCCDLGWTRFGIAVSDLDAAKAVLANWEIPVTGEIDEPGRPKRLAFREPFIGCYVELLEDVETLPGGMPPKHHDIGPAIIYASSSVSDLEAARRYYTETIGLEVADDIAIHGPQHEALWGLAGAKSESFVLKAGGFLLEIVKYLDPVGKPRRKDYTVADQGMLNVAIAARSRAPVEEAIARVSDAGISLAPTVAFGEACGTYVLSPEREIELCSVPAELEAAFGYVPSTPFFGQQF